MIRIQENTQTKTLYHNRKRGRRQRRHLPLIVVLEMWVGELWKVERFFEAGAFLEPWETAVAENIILGSISPGKTAPWQIAGALLCSLAPQHRMRRD